MPVIIFEGADGCGKNTLITSLYYHYESLGKKVRVYDDGYGFICPDDYQSVIKKPKISNKARFLLLQSIRADLYQSIFDYHLKNPDAIILMNRSILSSVVYQLLVNFDYTKDVGLTAQYFYNDLDRINFTFKNFSDIIDITIPYNFIKITKPTVVYMKADLDVCISRDEKMCDWQQSVEHNDFEKFHVKKDFLRKIIFCYDKLLGCDFVCNHDCNIIIQTLHDQLCSDTSINRLIFGSKIVTLDANKSKEELHNDFIELVGHKYIE